MPSYKVGYFVGSLATTSINRLLAKALVRSSPRELNLTRNDSRIGRCTATITMRITRPLQSRSRTRLLLSEARSCVTPEYRANRSIPGGLKNAIDWASRPYGHELFARKPSAVIGTSPGKIGTAIAQQHLRSILAFCNSPQMNAVEAYIQFEPGLITDEGRVTIQATEEFLRNYMLEFAGFIARVYTVLPRNP